MLQINYSKVVIDAPKYVDRHWTEYRNGTTFVGSMSNENNQILISSFSGFWNSRFFNCYKLQVPKDEEIAAFSVELANGIFTESVRSNNYSFISLLHYRNQLLTSGITIKYSFPRREPNDSYSIEQISILDIALGYFLIFW